MSQFKLQQKKLSNGLTTLLVPRQERQAVTVLALVGVGSRYETPRQAGLSHFLEHMFFKGTKNRPAPKEVAVAVDEVGGEFNAFTSEEYTGYYVKVAPEHVDRAVDVVSDIILNPLFPAEEIEKEKGVIVEEIRMYSDLPMRHIWHIWNKLQFGTHPLGQRIDGLEETVTSLKRSDFVRYTDRHYLSGNAAVVIAGNFETGPTNKLLRESFKSFSKGAATKPKAAPKKPGSQRVMLESRPSLDQTHIVVGVPGLSVTDPDRHIADVLATILGGGMSSRLFMSVREEHGYAYSVRTHSENYTDTGTFATQAGVRTDQAVHALELILQEYDRIMVEEVDEAELEKAKQITKGSLLLGLEETNSLAMFAATQHVLAGSIEKPDQILRKVEKITPQDIKRVALSLLNPAQRRAAILGPQKSATMFERALK